MDATKEPKIKERLCAFDSNTTATELSIENDILDIAPINDCSSSTWMILDITGALHRLNCEDATCYMVARIPIVAEPDHEPWCGRTLTSRLSVSNNGQFAAVVNDYGKKGVVMSLDASGFILQLDGGDYYPNTVPFSFSFFEHQGRTLIVHRTDWNRLDISNPANGDCLTEREFESWGKERVRPAHYLDYFHGRLIICPDGTLVSDDGWMWHPVGAPTIFSISAWLDGNPFESEDGPSLRSLCGRDWWDNAMCWIDSTRIAIEGLGDFEEEMLDGVRIFDVEKVLERGSWREVEEIASFPGPRSKFFSDGRRLFSTDEHGLNIWDIDDGARVLVIAGFQPTHQHVGAGELVELREKTMRRWKYCEGKRNDVKTTE